MSFESICVVGLGYIGLPTAAIFASKGRKVLGLEVNPEVIATINSGNVHIKEDGLEAMVKEAVDKGFLTASDKPSTADVFIIAVPTPFKGDHEPDLQYVEAAVKSIAPVLSSGNLVIVESTSPVGTTEKVCCWLAELRQDLKFPNYDDEPNVNVSYCPERVLPGKIIEELKSNDRVIGGMSDECSRRSIDLYKIFSKGKCIATNAQTAEMTKLTENAFRDVNIAFANELSMICEELDVDVWKLISLANRHPRVDILQPGPGVGGHCIAVDPWFIVNRSPELSSLIRVGRETNDKKADWVVNKVKRVYEDLAQTLPRSEQELTIGCLGLAFKANVGDLRESPSLQIVKQLSEEFEGVLAGDPYVLEQDCIDLNLRPWNEIVSTSQVLVILVDHDAFREINTAQVNAVVIDLRGRNQEL